MNCARLLSIIRLHYSVVDDGSIDDREDGSQTATTAHTSSAYSSIEAAHPLFGKVKTLWNSSLESHREVRSNTYASLYAELFCPFI